MYKASRKKIGNRKIKKKQTEIRDFEQYFKATPEELRWLRSTRRRKNIPSLIDMEEPSNIRVSVSQKGRKTVECFRAQCCYNCQNPCGDFNTLLYRDVKPKRKASRVGRAKVLHRNLNFEDQSEGESDLEIEDVLKVLDPPAGRRSRKKSTKPTTVMLAPKRQRNGSRNKKFVKRLPSSKKSTKSEKDNIKIEKQFVKMVSSASSAAVVALNKTLECVNVLEKIAGQRILIISSDSSSDEEHSPRRKRPLITSSDIKTEKVISEKTEARAKNEMEAQEQVCMTKNGMETTKKKSETNNDVVAQKRKSESPNNQEIPTTAMEVAENKVEEAQPTSEGNKESKNDQCFNQMVDSIASSDSE